jgi:hypothetical protein
MKMRRQCALRRPFPAGLSHHLVRYGRAAGSRHPQSHQVDLVADPTTINCDRLAWADFSTDYLDVHQRVLVPSGSKARGIGDLGGQKVCAAAGTTSIRAIAMQPSRPVPVAVPNWSDCLAMLQQGQVAACRIGLAKRGSRR